MQKMFEDVKGSKKSKFIIGKYVKIEKWKKS